MDDGLLCLHSLAAVGLPATHVVLDELPEPGDPRAAADEDDLVHHLHGAADHRSHDSWAQVCSGPVSVVRPIQPRSRHRPTWKARVSTRRAAASELALAPASPHPSTCALSASVSFSCSPSFSCFHSSASRAAATPLPSRLLRRFGLLAFCFRSPLGPGRIGRAHPAVRFYPFGSICF